MPCRIIWEVSMERQDLRVGQKVLYGPSDYWNRGFPVLVPAQVVEITDKRVRLMLRDRVDGQNIEHLKTAAFTSVQPLHTACHYGTVTPLTAEEAAQALHDRREARLTHGGREEELKRIVSEGTVSFVPEPDASGEGQLEVDRNGGAEDREGEGKLREFLRQAGASNPDAILTKAPEWTATGATPKVQCHGCGLVYFKMVPDPVCPNCGAEEYRVLDEEVVDVDEGEHSTGPSEMGEGEHREECGGCGTRYTWWDTQSGYDRSCPGCGRDPLTGEEHPEWAYGYDEAEGERQAEEAALHARLMGEQADSDARELAEAGLGGPSAVPPPPFDARPKGTTLAERFAEDELAQLPLIPAQRYDGQLRRIPVEWLPPDTELISPPPTAALIESVKRSGVQTPVLLFVRKLRSEYSAQDSFLVGAGRRRIKAARKAGVKTVPAVIWEVGQMSIEFVTLTENAQRSDNLLAALQAIDHLMQHGHTRDEICDAIGITKGQFDKMVVVRALLPPLREAMYDGAITPAKGLRIARLSVARQEQLLVVLSENGKVLDADIREAKMVGSSVALDQLAAGGMFDDMRRGPAPGEVRSQAAQVEPIELDPSLMVRGELSWRVDVYLALGDALNALPPDEGELRSAITAIRNDVAAVMLAETVPDDGVENMSSTTVELPSEEVDEEGEYTAERIAARFEANRSVQHEEDDLPF